MPGGFTSPCADRSDSRGPGSESMGGYEGDDRAPERVPERRGVLLQANAAQPEPEERLRSDLCVPSCK